MFFNKKNKPGKFIVFYSLDDKSGIEAANQAANKGFENAFYLTGGIETFGVSFPELIVGSEIPGFKLSTIRNFNRTTNLYTQAETISNSYKTKQKLKKIFSAIKRSLKN